MSQPLQIGTIEINQGTRLGRMLAAGRLTATMQSKRTSQHITLTFQCKVKKGKWENASFAEASHVFIKMGHGEWGSTKIGTYYPGTGKLYFDTNDRAWQYAARQTLHSATTGVNETEQFVIQEEERCARCAHELSDPISIAIGLGPDCEEYVYGTRTPRSEHYTQDQANLIVAEKFGGDLAETLVEETRKVVPTVPKNYDNVMRHEAEVKAETDKRGRNVPRTFEALAAAVKQ